MKHLLACLALALFPIAAVHAAEPIPVVAAENFYGDVAQQVGGSLVRVTSILTNPDQDPHLFEASPSVARNVSAARIVISSGLDYDPWMDKLFAAARNPARTTLVAAALAGKKPGDNPHIWYEPRTMRALATALAEELGRVDPAHSDAYRQHLAQFELSLQPIDAKIASLRKRLAGLPVTATEPVFGPMFDALGMQVRNQSFQLAVMNNTEPSASDVAAFETDLKMRQVRLLAYNSQASDAVARRMLGLAKASHIPVLAVTETAPPGKPYQAWMLGQLDALERALPQP